MRYGSVCSGIESASVAWHPLGWEPAFFAEIEKFPSAVLAHRWPGVPNLGDFTKIKETDIGTIDLLVGGTPCQSFSVAGKRLGLDDARGNLALEFLALARRLRPRWLVFENVPGLLSSDEWRDFGAFLGLLGQCGYGWAYRILDAQYVRVERFARAVPQRRRRVFVVGHFGDWRPAAAVLFEPEGLRGDSAPRREAGKGASPSVTSSTGGSSGKCHQHTYVDDEGEALNGQVQVANTRGKDVVADPISANEQKTYTHEGSTFRLRNVVPVLEAGARTGKSTDDPRAGSGIGEPGDPMFSLQSGKQHAVAFSCKDHGADASEDAAPTLRSMNEIDGNANAGGQIAVAFKPSHYTRGKDGAPSDAAPPLQVEADYGDQDPVIFQPRVARNGRGFEDDGAVPALNGADAGTTSDMRPCVATTATVRRLTPRECERLQGFPDDYTLVPYRSKPAADGPRYKALGNAMACNVMAWIGARISLFERVVLGRNAA